MMYTYLSPEYLNTLRSNLEVAEKVGINVPITLEQVVTLAQPNHKILSSTISGYLWPLGEPMNLETFLYLHGYLFSEAVEETDNSLTFLHSKVIRYIIRYRLVNSEEYQTLISQLVLVQDESGAVTHLTLIPETGDRVDLGENNLAVLILPRGETWRKTLELD